MSARSIVMAAAAAIVATAPVAAQDLGIKAPEQRGTIIVRGGTVHPVSGPDIARGYVMFRDGVIVALGAGDGPAAGSGVRVIDAAGLHVYPGLISPYSQLGLSEIGAVGQSSDFAETGRITPEVRAASSVNPDSTIIPVTRSNGVLTFATFPTGGVIAGRPAVMRADGWTWESMAIDADAGLVVDWPSMRPITAWWMEQSEEDQRKEIRARLDAIDAAFDAAAAHIAARDADPSHPLDVRWDAMRRVLAGERPVFVHAQDVDQIAAAVRWASERSLRLIIVGGRDAPLVADLLREHDVAVIVRGTHAFPKREDLPYDHAFTLPARLTELGVRWCMGANDDTPHERNLPYHAATAVAHGLSHEDALRSVTLWTAQILGVGDRLGSLEPGKAATLIVTTGSPLEVTTSIRAAFIDGREIDLSNKQTHLAEKYREKYRQQGGR